MREYFLFIIKICFFPIKIKYSCELKSETYFWDGVGSFFLALYKYRFQARELESEITARTRKLTMRQQRQLFFMLFLVCFLFKCGSAFKMSMQFEAIYQFGDSLNDNGNFIRLPTGWHSAYGRLPYGQALKMPTGRASDGLVIGDFIGMLHKFYSIYLACIISTCGIKSSLV